MRTYGWTETYEMITNVKMERKIIRNADDFVFIDDGIRTIMKKEENN